jgi:two-component system sensor histidine kinase TorS
LQVSIHPNELQNTVFIQFLVEDSGIGIAKNKQAEVFQAFTQVDTSSARRYGGIGLGLAICDRLVDVMGGKITLNSELGSGTEIGFTLEIGLCDSAPVHQQLLTVPIVNGIDVLMVEDDVTHSMVTSNYLEHLGYRVTAAQTGEEALKFLEVLKPSLVLLDISLPGIDGLTILKHIRTHADSLISNMPVIAMSAHVFTEEVESYLNAGMNGFLGKPFSIENLEQTILNVTNSGNSAIIDEPSNSKTHLRTQTFDASVVDADIIRLGFNRVEKIVGLYLKSSNQLMYKLLELIAKDNFYQTKTVAHKLNGAAGNFGFLHLCAILSEIEIMAIDNKRIPVTLMDQLQTIFGESTAALNLYMAKQAVN